jgi:hypothetical protein
MSTWQESDLDAGRSPGILRCLSEEPAKITIGDREVFRHEGLNCQEGELLRIGHHNALKTNVSVKVNELEVCPGSPA